MGRYLPFADIKSNSPLYRRNIPRQRNSVLVLKRWQPCLEQQQIKNFYHWLKYLTKNTFICFEVYLLSNLLNNLFIIDTAVAAAAKGYSVIKRPNTYDRSRLPEKKRLYKYKSVSSKYNASPFSLNAQLRFPLHIWIVFTQVNQSPTCKFTLKMRVIAKHNKLDNYLCIWNYLYIVGVCMFSR